MNFELSSNQKPLQSRRGFLNLVGLTGIASMLPIWIINNQSQATKLILNDKLRRIDVLGVQGIGASFVSQVNPKWFTSINFQIIDIHQKIEPDRDRIVIMVTGLEDDSIYKSIETNCKSCRKIDIQPVVVVITELFYCPPEKIKQRNDRCRNISRYASVLYTSFHPEKTFLNTLRFFDIAAGYKYPQRHVIALFNKYLSSSNNLYLYTSESLYSYGPSGITYHQEKIIETKKRVFNESYGGQTVKKWISMINKKVLDADEKDKMNRSSMYDKYIGLEFEYGNGLKPNKMTKDIVGYEKLMVLVMTQGKVEKYPIKPVGVIGTRKHFYSKNVSPEYYYKTLNQRLAK